MKKNGSIQLKIFKMDEYKGKIKYPSVVAFLDKSIALIKQNDRLPF